MRPASPTAVWPTDLKRSGNLLGRHVVVFVSEFGEDGFGVVFVVADVAHGGFDVGVAEELLDFGQRCAVIICVTGAGAAEVVGWGQGRERSRQRERIGRRGG